jgi:hypothetical protein
MKILGAGGERALSCPGKAVKREIYYCDFLWLCNPARVWPTRPWVFLITHNDTPQSVGLLWTSDQLVAETSTWQHTTYTTNIHARSGIQTHNCSRQTAVDLHSRPHSHWDWQNMKYKEPANRTVNSYWPGLGCVFLSPPVIQKGHLPCKLLTQQSHFFTLVSSVSTWMQSFNPKMQNISIYQQNPVPWLRRPSSKYHVL